MPSRLSRRRFLQASAATAAVGFWPSGLPAAQKPDGPNEKLHIGVIGITNRGGENIRGLEEAGGMEIVALCDVDENRAGKVRERFPKASFDVDFRKLFERKGLDAILVATPDHSHAIPTLMALRGGLHVYCEKPLAHTVEEVRLVTETAAKTKRVTQMGTQIHAGENYRRVVELVQSGAIGPVQEVHVWCDKSWGGGERPEGKEDVPKGLHWDLWLGPAPVRPFVHKPDEKGHGVYHPYNWRSWWDFGGGTLNDMACHHMDLPFWALKLKHPTKVSATGPKPHPETAAVKVEVVYEYPARGDLPPVTLTWYDGGLRPGRLKEIDAAAKLTQGTLFVGAKGMLLADYGRRYLLPEADFKGFKAPEPTIAKSLGHHKEWIEACKSGGPTTCNFGYSGPLTESVLLGTVSYRSGKPLVWDAKNLKADVKEAEKYLRKEYRKPWTL